MQADRTEGIILQAIKFQDYDQIITVFTPADGVVKFFVKGALRPKYNQGALTAPLSRAEFVYKRGKSELLVCQEISMLNQHLSLRQDIDQLEAAFDLLLALISSQLGDTPAPDLYNLLVSYLEKLAIHSDPWALAASFRLKILRHEGRLGLSQNCAHCNTALQTLYFSEGECYCRSHAPPGSQEFDPEEIELLLALAYCRTHGQLAALTISSALRHKIKLLFQSCLY